MACCGCHFLQSVEWACGIRLSHMRIPDCTGVLQRALCLAGTQRDEPVAAVVVAKSLGRLRASHVKVAGKDLAQMRGGLAVLCDPHNIQTREQMTRIVDRQRADHTRVVMVHDFSEEVIAGKLSRHGNDPAVVQAAWLADF